MTFQKGVKFRIYPNREQRNLIDRTLGCSRLIYNKGRCKWHIAVQCYNAIAFDYAPVLRP